MASKVMFEEEDWESLGRDWTAWWNHDLGRPMVMGNTRIRTSRPRPAWWNDVGRIQHNIPAEDVAEEMLDDVRRTIHHGDAWPREWMNFGPGIAAAFLGGDAHPSPETMWFTPGKWKGVQLRGIRPEYDEDNPWWRRVQDLTQACVAAFGRSAVVGITDIGGNLDIAASLRDTEPLLMDCLDDPEGVDMLCRRITPLWLRYYDEQCSITEAAGRGTCCWASLWSPGRTYMLQSDFSYMISPALFERWVAPDITECCRHMDHGFYHLDGKGELPHLDVLLSIPELRGIQWIPGDGQPESGDPAWWPVLRRIRAAGKLVQIYTSGKSALRMAQEIPLNGFAIDIGWGEDSGELVDAILKTQE